MMRFALGPVLAASALAACAATDHPRPRESRYDCQVIVSGPAERVSLSAGAERPLGLAVATWEPKPETRADLADALNAPRPTWIKLFYDVPEADIHQTTLSRLLIELTRSESQPCPTRIEATPVGKPDLSVDMPVKCLTGDLFAARHQFHRTADASGVFVSAFDSDARVIITSYFEHNKIERYTIDLSDVSERDRLLAEAGKTLEEITAHPDRYYASLAQLPDAGCIDVEEFIRGVTL